MAYYNGKKLLSICNVNYETDSLTINFNDNSIKGIVATVADLPSTSTSDSIYIVADTGHWYYYNNGWVDGGVYQATEIADGSITENKLNDALLNNIDCSKDNLITFAQERKLRLNIDNINWVNNAVDKDNGHISNATNIRLTNKELIEVRQDLPINIIIPSGYSDMNAYGFNENTEDAIGTQLAKGVLWGTIPKYKYYRFVFHKGDGNEEFISTTELLEAGLQIYYEVEDQNDVVLKNAIQSEVGKNLFNKEEVVIGHLDADGAVYSNVNYYTTGLIPVEVGKTYVISPSIRKFMQYNADKEFIASTHVNVLTTNYTFVAQYNYVRFTLPIGNIDIQMLEAGDTPSGYAPYQRTLPNNLGFGSRQVEQLQDMGVGNKLSNKILYAFGDSISQGTGDYIGGFSKAVAVKNGMQLTNYAMGGATVTTIEGSTNNILNQISGASEVIPDFIVFNGYTNDCIKYDSGDITLGELDYTSYSNFDDSNFTGAFEKILLELQTKYKGAKIIYVSPHRMSSRAQATQNTLHERAIEICKKWCIPVVDLFNEGGLNTNIASYKLAYTNDTYDTGTGDGTHPNQAGYERFYLPLIEAKMKELI